LVSGEHQVIKAVYFDWFNTLANYDPPREQLYQDAFKEEGKDLSFHQVYRGLLVADRKYFALVSRGLVKNKSSAEREEILTLYPEAIGNENGISTSHEAQLRIIRQALKHYTSRQALYKDVLPLFEELKKRNYLLGIITNADETISKMVVEMGLKPYLRAVITSQMVMAEKPDPAIFQAAYDEAGIEPAEMVYVGDTYKSDVLGAKNAGSQGILLDRYGQAEDITGCIRITSLTQLLDYV
jgi:putative hydrolase of the HAD superfamily